MNKDVVIASVPWTDTDAPLMAPGILKSALAEIGIDSLAIDLNQEVRQQVNLSPNKTQILSFLLKSTVEPDTQPVIRNLFEFMADRILAVDPQWVCLSLLTHLSQHSCRWLCWIIKKKRPDVKIVIGGAGCFISLKSIDGFAMDMKSSGLVDHYIAGDGEKSIQQLILGNVDYPGIDQPYWKELENLDQLPTPDYSDYNFDLYRTKSVSIWGSRGCVRECTFCDIHKFWNRYQWRSAESIFKEMQYQNQRYGITIFNFADSLINGNQKEYRKLIRLLAEYNRDKEESQRIRWTSFFIFRPASDMTEEDWRLTAESGALLLLVGVESFVEHIRKHIKKHFDNQDLDVSLRMAQKYNIPLRLLLLVGYVTETEEDHQEQLRWIEQNKHFAGNPVISCEVGSTLAILPDTWLDQNRKALGVELLSDDVFQEWINDKGSTPEVRMRWHKEITEQLQRYGFDPSYVEDNHVLIEQYIKNVKK